MTTSDLIASVAVFIALLALAATFWQAHIARKHNLLSVRPHITMNETRHFPGNGLRLTLSVQNVGLGPAVVKSAAFECNGKLISGGAIGAAQHLIQPTVTCKVMKHGLPGIGTAVPVGVEDVVLEIEALNVTEDTFGTSLQQNAIVLKLVYASLYGEHFVCIGHVGRTNAA